MKRRLLCCLFGLCLFAGCSTSIKAPEEMNKPSKIPFGTFSQVYLLPMKTDVSGHDSGDRAAIVRVQENLNICMRKVFPNLTSILPANTASTLKIQPEILDLKKVTIAERLFLGPMAGSSATLLKITFVDMTTNQIIAEPIFYSKANAWGGMATAGATDNVMLTRITGDACEYAQFNLR